jgi:hypothetical protein
MKTLVVLGLTFCVASAHAFIIDDFTSGAFNSGYISSGTQSDWTAASVPGGVRLNFITIQNNPLGNDARVRVLTTFGVYQFSSEPSVDAQVSIGYGFATGSGTVGSNPLNMNLTTNPILSVFMRSNDVAMPTSMRIFTNNGANMYTRNVSVSGGITPSSSQVINYDFTSDAALLGDVDAIVMDFDAQPDGDFSLTYLAAVPEPTSMAVLGLGAAALLRRRKKA